MRFFAVVLALLSAALLAGADLSARLEPGNVDIYSASVDGGRVQNLTESPDVDDAPVVSPNGRKIAFVRGMRPTTDIYVMNADGSGQTQRTGAAEEERDPAWGPDSSALAFTYFVAGSASPSIRVLGWAGRDVRRPGQHARFAPRGSVVAFQDPTGISTVRRTGAPFRRLLRASARSPVWSPRGQRIAFERVVGSTTWIAVMNADGTRQRRLTRGTDPVWSRRGLIAFVRGGDVFVVRPDGRGVRRLTRGAAVDSAPSWSPDGTKLAFVRQAGSVPLAVFVVRSNGIVVGRVSQDGWAVTPSRPSWSPDGRLVYFAARLPTLPP